MQFIRYAPIMTFTPNSGTIKYEFNDIPACYAKEFGIWSGKAAEVADYIENHRQELLQIFYNQKEQESQIEK